LNPHLLMFVVGLVLVTLLLSSFVRTKSVRIASVGMVWCTVM